MSPVLQQQQYCFCSAFSGITGGRHEWQYNIGLLVLQPQMSLTAPHPSIIMQLASTVPILLVQEQTLQFLGHKATETTDPGNPYKVAPVTVRSTSSLLHRRCCQNHFSSCPCRCNHLKYRTCPASKLGSSVESYFTTADCHALFCQKRCVLSVQHAFRA